MCQISRLYMYRPKILWFESNLSKIARPVAAIKSLKMNRLPHILSNFLIFGFIMHNNIDFLNSNLMIKYTSKFGMFGDFCPFSLFFSFFYSGTMKLGSQLYQILSGVCKVWPLEAIFSGSFWPQIGPKLGQKSVFHIFCKRFPLDQYESFFFKLTSWNCF